MNNIKLWVTKAMKVQNITLLILIWLGIQNRHLKEDLDSMKYEMNHMNFDTRDIEDSLEDIESSLYYIGENAETAASYSETAAEYAENAYYSSFSQVCNYCP